MAIAPLAAAAAISGISSIGSSLVTNAGTRRAAKFAARANLKQWHRQNEYNHPIAQMERLKAAGLNPNLIYGSSPGSATGNASDIPRVNAPDYKFDNPLSELQQFADYGLKQVQSDNVQAQTNVATQEALLKSAQTAETLSKGASAKVRAEIDRELKQTTMDAQKEQLRNLEREGLGRDLDNSFKDQTIRDRVKTVMYEAAAAKETLKGKQLDNRMKQLDIELRRMGIYPGDPWYIKIMGQAKEQVIQHMTPIWRAQYETGKQLINKFKK